MRFAYADPPYLGLASFYAKHHPEALVWDDPETHRQLIERLCSEFPDGWAMSLHTPSLRVILPMCPNDARVGAWVKPFCSFKSVNPAYAWEPVIFRGGRKPDRKTRRLQGIRTVRDWVAANMAMERGLVGAKPDPFCWWIFDLLGMEPDDEFHDLFPGSGAVSRAWESYKRAKTGFPLFSGT